MKVTSSASTYTVEVEAVVLRPDCQCVGKRMRSRPVCTSVDLEDCRLRVKVTGVAGWCSECGTPYRMVQP